MGDSSCDITEPQNSEELCKYLLEQVDNSLDIDVRGNGRKTGFHKVFHFTGMRPCDAYLFDGIYNS